MRWVLSSVALVALLVAGCVQPASEAPLQTTTKPAAKPSVTTAPPPPAAPPAVDFRWAGEPSAGSPLSFKANWTSPSGALPQEYRWNFGYSGQLSDEAEPTHAFPEGSFKVRLAVTGSDGKVAETLRHIAIGPPNATTVANDEVPAPPVQVADEIQALRSAILAANGATPVRLDGFLVDTFLGYDSEGSSRPVLAFLKPGLTLAPDFWAEVDGVRIPRPFVEVYEGHVEGEPEQLVRLTIAETWARGSARIGDTTVLIRYGLDGNLPPSASEGLRSLPLAAAPPALIDGPSFDESVPCNTLTFAGPVDATPMADLGMSTKGDIVAKVILDSDGRYRDGVGPDGLALMVAILNEMDSIYDHETSIRLQVIGVHQHSDRDAFPDPEVEAPVSRLEGYWDDREAGQDLVHLFTGWPSSFAQANCIGAAGHPAGVSFSPIAWESEYVVFHTHAFAHEFGHLFAAHHHYGNHAESELATIMIQGYTPGARPVFGTLEKSVIRGWAEDNL